MALLYLLPQFLFNYSSLVKLTTHNCMFKPNGKVNWGCLTVLIIQDCRFSDQGLERILCGSPLLESLELSECVYPSDKFVIASKFMKRLVLRDLQTNRNIQAVEISCPKLEELSIEDVDIYDHKVFCRAVENVLLGSLLLESLELTGFTEFEQLVITSKSLKRLVLGELNVISHVEISCPKLEKLKLLRCVYMISANLLNLPASVYATLDFYYEWDLECTNEDHWSLIKDLLQQLQHVKKLKIGCWIMEIMSAIYVGDLLCPVLNVTCLTLNDADFKEHHSGIACVLHNSPMLEKLVIKLSHNEQRNDDLPKLNDIEENYWKSDLCAYDCLVSHLKTTQITGCPKRDDKRKFVLNFVRFVLENARVLEKMILEWEDNETTFPFKVSQELLSFPRYSRHAIVELLCSK